MNFFRSAPSVPYANLHLTVRLWNILRIRLRSLLFPGSRESELTEEFAARRQALRTFGGVEQVRVERRDARGTAFIEDTVRDILYAFRTFQRAPLVAFTIVSTVALGLGLVAAVFTVLNALVFRVDAVPDVHEMFAVERPQAAGEPVRFTRETFDALRRETSVFSDVYAQVGDIDSRVDGRLMYGTFVTGNFFQVLRVSPAMGRALTPADDDVNLAFTVLPAGAAPWMAGAAAAGALAVSAAAFYAIERGLRVLGFPEARTC